jgi:hypothetical protein
VLNTNYNIFKYRDESRIVQLSTRSSFFQGGILVDEGQREMGVWIREADDQRPPPTTLEEVMESWRSTAPEGRRTVAVGLGTLEATMCPNSAVVVLDCSSLEVLRRPAPGQQVLMNSLENGRGNQQRLVLLGAELSY